KLGREWSGTADINLDRGEVMGLAVTQWHVPLTFAYGPPEGRGQITVPETRGQAGRGQITGNVDISWDYAAQVRGKLLLSRVDVQTFLRQTAGSAQWGGGLMPARFHIAVPV